MFSTLQTLNFGYIIVYLELFALIGAKLYVAYF